MNINCIGPVTVATPGTPVSIATDPGLVACKLYFQPLPEITGDTYLGKPSMDKGTLNGVARVFAADTDGFFLESQDGTNSIRLKDYAVDADVAGEGMLVTYWTE